MLQPPAALSILVGMLALLDAGAPGRAENWPRFRGPGGMGHTTDADLPVRWGGKDKENVLWSAPLVGRGHASPIVWGDRVFICTVNWPATVKDRTKVIPDHHVLCYRASDGKRLWDTTIPPGQWLRTDFRSGPGGGYAAPTPTTDGKYVYCAFGSSVIAAVDFHGKIAWRKEIEPHTFDVTVGSSPILYGRTVILVCAMAKKSDSRIVAFDRDSGDVAWEARLPTTGFGHSTPIVINVAGKDQMIVAASASSKAPDALQSFAPGSGKRLWWCWGCADAASPVYGAGVVYVDSGRGGPGVAVDPTGRGDVTETHVKWKLRNVAGSIGSPIIAAKHLYRLHGQYVDCWRADTGERVFSKKLPGISSAWASPVADARGRVYFANAGKSYVLKAGGDFEVLAVNDLGDGNHPSPAVANGRMFLVGMKNVFCIGAR